MKNHSEFDDEPNNESLKEADLHGTYEYNPRRAQ